MDKEASFVALIDITNKDSNSICCLINSLLTINQFMKRMDFVPSPVPKLHNSDDDSVKSREMLSRKRKRETKNGANIEDGNRNGRTPLYDAIEKRKIEVTEFLLKHKASDRDNDGLSPLHLAADIDCLEIIEHLLKYGANINCSCTSTSISKGYAPLHCAVENGRKEVVTFLLSRGVNVDIQGEDGITPLHIAANKGYISIAEDLLNYAACIHSLTLKEGYMPIHFACELGNEEAVKLFLDRGANINASTKGNLTPLSIATKEGHNTVVKLLLLSYKADINAQDKSGKTPIFYAIENADSKIAKLLLTNGANIKDSPELLNTAVKKECVEIVEALLQHGADVNGSGEHGRTALHWTVINHGYNKNNNRAEIAKVLLTKGANVDAQDKYGGPTLHWAVVEGYIEVVKVLLECGADVNSVTSGRTALHWTAINYTHNIDENIRAEIAKLLLTKGANADAQTETLQFAVYYGYKEVVKVLLECGADVNTCDEDGRTALHFTAINFNNIDENIREEIAKLLLIKGANADVQDKYGKTTLHYAVYNGYTEVVKVLLECDAEVNASDEEGLTAFHFTAINYNITDENIRAEITKLFLIKGANADVQDKYGKTTLHYAVKTGYKEVVKVLLECGADVNVCDKDGQTALHFASRVGYIETVATLLEYGSDINITSRNNHTALDLAMAGFETGETVKAFRYHIVKMKTANLYISEKNLQSLHGSDEILGKFQEECEKEIASIKSEKINGTRISFYDILAKDSISLEMYMRNNHIVQVLKSDGYKIKFPKYASMIGSNFKKAMERKKLLEQSYKIFHFLVNNFPELPYNCTEKIFSYLSNKDLQIFVDACKPLSIPNPNPNPNSND